MAAGFGSDRDLNALLATNTDPRPDLTTAQRRRLIIPALAFSNASYSSTSVLQRKGVRRMSRIARRILFWSPRTLTILFALFLSMFALDALGEGHGFWQTVLALSIHLVPPLLIVAVLLVAWRWEWVGALLYAMLATAYAVRVLPAHISWALTIALPMLIIAALFLINWRKRSELRFTR